MDPSVSNDDLLQIFGAYGEVKEVQCFYFHFVLLCVPENLTLMPFFCISVTQIRETPHKRYHKFIEFYDIRAAEAALKSLNRSDIAGKRIKLEPSRPGGARRRCLY